MAYRLALPPQLAGVHNVFHIFMLRKYKPHSSHIINWEEINLDEDMTFEEKSVKILDRREKKLRGKTMPLVRVLWKHRGTEESTWERDDMICANYHQLFESKDWLKLLLFRKVEIVSIFHFAFVLKLIKCIEQKDEATGIGIG
ncbi:uncharacterized protein LOC114257157 [Camellia sinensis]|uniref:uncharacterized protein LOC114257157 n=1 Tax=Camellia sinensis TaxID=4442 RepID=UPI0010368763|nr:uncharacterized protein LOC114257157 [Camellia sinensis]